MNDGAVPWPRTPFISRTAPAPTENTREEIPYRAKCFHDNSSTICEWFCGDGPGRLSHAALASTVSEQRLCHQIRESASDKHGPVSRVYRPKSMEFPSLHSRPDRKSSTTAVWSVPDVRSAALGCPSHGSGGSHRQGRVIDAPDSLCGRRIGRQIYALSNCLEAERSGMILPGVLA